MSALIIPIQDSTGGSTSVTSKVKEMRRRVWKERNELSLSADDMIVYVENPKKPTKCS